jgi:hypothetical protein
MAQNSDTIIFQCPTCKRKGEVVVYETDHPYSTDFHVRSVTEGFEAVDPRNFSATVFCKKCDTKIL